MEKSHPHFYTPPADTKPPTQMQSPFASPGRRLSFRRAGLILLVLTLWILSQVILQKHRAPSSPLPPPPPSSDESTTLTTLSPKLPPPITLTSNSTSQASLVPLEAHIMSRCPDAAYCLAHLLVPVMSLISSKTSLRLSYIGHLSPPTSPHDPEDVSCMHGPAECLGNIILLCAERLYTNETVRWLGFANCMLSSYADIPQRALVEGCAMEHGVDFQKVNACISDEGGEGMELLRQSVRRSADAGVSKSCTVRLDGRVRCVRDGGRWYDCEGGSEVDDLVRDVERLWEERNGGGKER